MTLWLWIGLLLAVLGWFAVLVLVLTRRGGEATGTGLVHGRYSSRLTTAIGVTLLVSWVSQVAVALTSTGDQVFAQAGRVKDVAVPIAILSFLWALQTKRQTALRRVPLWFVALPAILVFSTCASLLVPRQQMQPYAAIEGVLLPCFFTISAWAGLRADEWHPSDKRRLITYLIAAMFMSLTTRGGFGPITALAVPTTFVALYLGARSGSHGKVSMLACATVGAIGLASILIGPAAPARAASAGTMAELLVCAIFVVLLLFVPRAVRVAAASAVAAAVVVLGVHAGYFPLLLGNFSYADVTLAQRGYEASMVIRGLDGSAVSVLIGLGPGATIDLSGSPDWRTLASSGRNLIMVEDVHLLPSHMLLKFGLAGLVFLALLFWSIARETTRQLASLRPDSFIVVLLLYALSGAAYSVPAATNIFTNPMIAVTLAAAIAARGDCNCLRPAKLLALPRKNGFNAGSFSTTVPVSAHK